MIGGVSAYLTVKASNVAWLGDIPTGWHVQPNRALFSEIKNRGHDTEEMLSVLISMGIIRQSALLADTKKRDSSNQDRSKYKLVEPGDIAYNKMRAWQGAIGLSDLRGIISPAYVVIRLRTADEPRYFHYLFRTPAFAAEAQRLSYGISSDQWSLRPEQFKQIYSCVPPVAEQKAIVHILHVADVQIQRYVRAKRKIIDLLREQKQAIINGVITRGLEAHSRSLIPSGVEWLGEIPEGWECRRAKSYFKEIDDRSVTGSEERLSVSHITGVTRRSEKTITMFMAESYEGHKRCHPGDLVVNTMWAWMGALGVAAEVGIVSPSYAVYRPTTSNDFYSPYAEALLKSHLYLAEYRRRSTGIRSSRLRLYPDRFLRMEMIRPPLAEQRRIMEAIRSATIDLDRAIGAATRQIALSREWLSRLASDVVMGRLDVRHVVESRLDDIGTSTDRAQEDYFDPSIDGVDISELEDDEDFVA